MSIRTTHGNVGLRKPRDPQKIVLHGSKGKDSGAKSAPEVEVKRNWLKTDQKGKKKDDKSVFQSDTYRTHVKQAMLIASAQMDKEDVTGPDPQTLQQRPPDQMKEMEALLDRKIEAMVKGTAPVPLGAGMDREGQRAAMGEHVKHMLKKRSRRFGSMRTRWFAIDSGKLEIYKHNRPGGKATEVYELKNVNYRFEESRMPGISEKFPEGKTERIQVNLPERPHGPLYLYGRDGREVKSWERAIKMSKFLQSPSDREALAFVVTKVTGSVIQKGWDALFAYAKELVETKALVKRFAHRLMRVELSRGWVKMRLVYQMRSERDNLKGEREAWAAKVLQEKMMRLSETSGIRDVKLVRASIINQVQTKFRNYRQERIFERSYPLGSSVMTRVQQALTGRPMGAGFKSLESKEALSLTLDTESWEQMRRDPTAFTCKQKTYSEVNVPVGKVSISVSEGFNLLSFVEVDDDSEHSHLSKAGWAHFVNLDQISSVVLHSERQMNARGKRLELPASMCGGTWLTINGPRVCWCRQIRPALDPQTREERQEMLGATDPFSVAYSLARGQRVKWFKLAVQVKSASVPKPEMPESDEIKIGNGNQADDVMMGDEDPPLFRGGRNNQTGQRKDKAERQTYMILHVLGRRYQSEKMKSESPQYFGASQRLEAEVPLCQDDQSLAVLDESEIGVDIVEWNEDPEKCLTIWAGKIPLWKVFAPVETLREQEEQQAKKRSIGNAVMQHEEREEIISLSRTLNVPNDRPVRKSTTLRLVTSYDLEGKQFVGAAVDLDISAGFHESAEPGKIPISPELSGAGAITTLYTTHRGAWFDGRLGKDKFFVDKVANFVEITIKDLTFPRNDKVDSVKLSQYYVEAKIFGTAVRTPSLYRAQETWKTLIPVDTQTISYEGTKLFLPLPPGIWCDKEHRRVEVEIAVMVREHSKSFEAPLMKYEDLRLASGKPPSPVPGYDKVFHGLADLDNMLVDQPKEKFLMTLSREAEAPYKMHVLSGRKPPPSQTTPVNPAVISMDIALRDRDYVRLNNGIQNKDSSPLNDGVLCVGDKACLRVEEAVPFPQTSTEYRRRLIPPSVIKDGQPIEWDQNSDESERIYKSYAAKGTWPEGGAPLRNPCMSHEYVESNLDTLENPPPFNQRLISQNADEVIPYKYVLPGSEMKFLQECRPGVFWRVIEALVKEGKKPKPFSGGRQKMQGMVIDKLSHIVKSLPVTVLAVYADGTCDLEIAPVFMHEWKRKPDSRFTIPGRVVIKDFTVTHDDPYILTAQTGVGDVSNITRTRVVLREVPISSVCPTQAASFNIYDAAFDAVDEALKVSPSKLGNDFDPCRVGEKYDDPAFVKGRSGSYAFRPGPVPADVGPSCKYEWQLHLHAPSEDAMYHFVTSLRQAVRMDLFEKTNKMREFKKKSGTGTAAKGYRMGPVTTSESGQLEVVLVEARHLRPRRVQKDKDMKMMMQRRTQVEQSPLVTFTLKQADKPGSELVFRGSKMQSAPAIKGDNPNWSEVDDFEKSGGWVFKSPQIQKTETPKLIFELQVLNQASSVGRPQLIGMVQVPVFGPPLRGKGGVPSINLCDRDVPFHNLWLPLSHPSAEDDLIPNKTGELHIMTMWVPSKQTNRTNRGPQTARQWLTKSMNAKLASPILRDAMYENQVFKHGYNPNSQRDQFPEKPSEATARHVEECGSAAPYLECIERQDLAQWENFQHDLRSKQKQEKSSGIQKDKLFELDEETWEVQLQSSGLTSADGIEIVGNTGKQHKLQLRDSGFGLAGDPPGADEFPLHVSQVTESAVELEYRPLGLWRKQWASGAKPNELQLYELNDLLRRGVAPPMRKQYWLEITLADQAQRNTSKAGDMAAHSEEMYRATAFYAALVRMGRPGRSDAMLQLIEDTVGATTWETQGHPQRTATHMNRLHQAQNVCIALIQWSKTAQTADDAKTLKLVQQEFPKYGAADFGDNGVPKFDWDAADNMATPPQPQPCGVAYCESLLYLAFNMLLAFQVPAQDKEASLQEGAYVTVISDPDGYQKECRAIGLTWPDGPGGIPRLDALEQRARIMKMDLDKKTVQLSDKVGWVPIKGLVGFENWGSRGAHGSAQTNKADIKHKGLDVAANKYDEAEIRVFWLLHAIIGSPKNQGLRDYYGIPAPFDNRQYMPTTGVVGVGATYAQDPDPRSEGAYVNPIADRKGPSEDINRLMFFIGRFERDLWIHLGALGFHPSVVFYGAFMRLFASFLPTASLFRYWDMVLSELSNPMRPKHKPARHILIDLAFGVMKICRGKLLCAESALEARDIIVECLEGMYDPSEVIRIVIESEEYLWDEATAGAMQKVGLDHAHVMEYEKQVKMWEQYFVQFRAQNVVLRRITQETELAADMVPQAKTAGKGAAPDTRMSTKNVMNHIIPTLQELLITEGSDRSKFGGMIRQTPAKLRELGPEIEGSVMEKLGGWASWAWETVMPEDLTQSVAFGVKPPPETEGEPSHLSKLEFSRQVQRGLGAAWNRFLPGIYETFEAPTERRLSLNEFFIALICCSKGTVGEKAMALFSLYSYAEKTHGARHIHPVTQRAHMVVEKIEGLQDKLQGAMFFKPPHENEVPKTTVLHIKISTQDGSMPHEVTGEVFIPSLRPFIFGKTAGDAQVTDFTIWGVSKRLPIGWKNMGNTKDGVLRDYGIRPVLGQLQLRIKWVPSDQQHVGTLVVRVVQIKFSTQTVEAPKTKNPSIEIVTYDDNDEKKIKTKNGHNMEWTPTMKIGTLGKEAHTGAATNGWDIKKEAWVWNKNSGTLETEANGFTFNKELAKAASQRPNTISLEACRLITQGILNRSLQCVTTRQASLISDQIFNRAAAVPAILDAVIVQGETQELRYASLKELKADFDSKRKSYVNVTHQLILAHENSVCVNVGCINLFPPTPGMGGNTFLNLNSIKVQDPFPQTKKVMWIRYARAGDGERCNAKFDVSEEGTFRPANVPLDMGMNDKKEKVQMSVTKEEFVTCILQNPILCENLRQLSSRDNNPEKVPSSAPLKIDITIADPQKEAIEADDLMDSMTVRQGVLFEVWDNSPAAKTGGTSFLGEAMLPMWDRIGPTPVSFALPLEEYVEGTSRHDPHKIRKAGTAPVTGYITVEASWNFPADPPADLPEKATPKEIAAYQEKLHTGLLKLKILKADNLFAAEDEDPKAAKKKLKKYGDPYVICHIRNEAMTKNDHLRGFNKFGWRAHPEFKTHPKKATASPEWGDEKDIQLKTGSFELKEYHDKNNRVKTRVQDTDEHTVIGDTEELKLHFGDDKEALAAADKSTANNNSNKPDNNASHGKTPGAKPGHRHNVEVYLSDSIEQFKHKLQIAARMEADKETDPRRRHQYEAIADEISHKHVVMVFVPSAKLRELAKTKAPNSPEYSRAYKDELRLEPSAWQPLDSMRTFNHYSTIYAFGTNMTQKLRICEGTEDYRLRNNRYMHFMNEQEKWKQTVQMTDTDKECYGYAKYVHKQDGNSTEWRPVLAQRVPGGAGDKRRYAVSFIHTPLSTPSSAPQASRLSYVSADGGSLASGHDMHEEDHIQEVEEDAVLLWPRLPQIDGTQDLEHQDLLQRKALQLAEQGMTEDQIADALNAELERKYSSQQKDGDGSRGPHEGEQKRRISVSDVRHAMKQAELEDEHDIDNLGPREDTGDAVLLRPQAAGGPSGSGQ